MTSELGFSIGEVAAMLRMRPATIRAWERRYGAVTPARESSRRRRYTLEQLELLRRIKVIAASGSHSVRLAVLEARGLTNPYPEPQGVDAGQLQDEVRAPWHKAADLARELEMFVGRDGRIVDANIAVARAFDRVRETLRRTRLVDLVDPYDRAKATQIYRGVHHLHQWELNLRTRPPGLYSFDCWPIRAAGQTLTFIRGTAHDEIDVDWGKDAHD